MAGSGHNLQHKQRVERHDERHPSPHEEICRSAVDRATISTAPRVHRVQTRRQALSHGYRSGGTCGRMIAAVHHRLLRCLHGQAACRGSKTSHTGRAEGWKMHGPSSNAVQGRKMGHGRQHERAAAPGKLRPPRRSGRQAEELPASPERTWTGATSARRCNCQTHREQCGGWQGEWWEWRTASGSGQTTARSGWSSWPQLRPAPGLRTGPLVRHCV